MTPATFYTVNAPRHVYYAVRNHTTGKIWTERTELAAQQQARDEDLALIESLTLSHSQLLDLMIPHGPSTPKPAPPEHAGPNEPTRVGVTRVQTGLTHFLRRFRRE
jgi:hypothetical protein